jgi:hypothetical protein
MTRRLAVLGIGTLLCMAPASRGAAQVQYPYQYAAKVVCGRPDPTLVTLTPQTYATTINVHNPSDTLIVVFLKKLAFTVPFGHQRPGRVVPISLDTLRADQALVIDCLDLSKRRGVGTASFEGFIILESSLSLDVTAVYTVPGGIDVEQIRERVRR